MVERVGIDVQRNASTVVVAMSGELDAASSPPALATVSECAADPETDEVVLDLSQVSFIDSSGLHVIALAAQRVDELGQRLVVANATPFALRLLATTGVADLVVVEDRG
jgi:anti-anti-sigma factor